MEMIDRIHNEVNLACMKENPDWDGKSFDYGCSCYQSAFKAYKSMYDDGHSGYSWGVTANILWRLIHDKPLTPIEDTPDVWHKVWDTKGGGVVYQCDRMPSLFKEVDSNDHITYTDHDRVVAIYNGQSVYGSMCRDVDSFIFRRSPCPIILRLILIYLYLKISVPMVTRWPMIPTHILNCVILKVIS